jgi:hypothetical protein
MAQCPDAWWQPISANFNAGMMRTPIRGLVIHITDGLGDLNSVWADFNRPAKRASAHFCVDKLGDMWQFIDTDNRAWAIDGGSHDAQWISVENIATLGQQLTVEQVLTCAMLLRWLHEIYQVPFKRAHGVSESGLGYHHMFRIGDHVCPGVPVRLQLEGIVRQAWYMWWRDTGDDSVPLYIRALGAGPDQP